MTSASYLFVPATHLDRVEKARAGAAHDVIVDLEDGVAAGDKGRAREHLALIPTGRPVHVRVNPRSTRHHHDDVRAVAAMATVPAVVVPKVEAVDDVAAVAASLPAGTPVLAIVETARGILAAEAIAGAGVARIIFGIADYVADLGTAPGPEVLAYPRSRLAVASRAAGLPAPVDGPTLATGDEQLVRSEAAAAKALGMGGKLCIHPTQVEVVNDVFATSEQETRWARAVLAAAEAHGGGAFTFEGSMVDEPVLIRARRLVEPDPTT